MDQTNNAPLQSQNPTSEPLSSGESQVSGSAVNTNNVSADQTLKYGSNAVEVSMQSVQKAERNKRVVKILILSLVIFAVLVPVTAVFIWFMNRPQTGLGTATYEGVNVKANMKYLKGAKLVSSAQTGTGALSASNGKTDEKEGSLTFLVAPIPNDNRLTLTFLMNQTTAATLGASCSQEKKNVPSVSGPGELCVMASESDGKPITYLYETSKNGKPYTALISFDFDPTNPDINDKDYRSGVYRDLGGNLEVSQIEQIAGSIDIQ